MFFRGMLVRRLNLKINRVRMREYHIAQIRLYLFYEERGVRNERIFLHFPFVFTRKTSY